MWYTNIFRIKRAKKDIVVIKPLIKATKKPDFYWDVEERCYKINKVYTALMKIKRNGLFGLVINGGFRSYSTDGVVVSNEALTYKDEFTYIRPEGILTIGIIPKGSLYTEKEHMILSEKIKIVWDELTPVKKSF